MAWADWCVPTVSDEQRFEIEKYRRVLNAMSKDNPDRLAEISSEMLKQNVLLQSVIKKATAHILALEAAQALAECPQWRVKMHPAVKAWRLMIDRLIPQAATPAAAQSSRQGAAADFDFLRGAPPKS